MQSGDRMICVFISKQVLGHTFKDWPLHITIIPWFRLSIASSELANQLHKQYIGSQSFQINVLQEALFGFKKNKIVNTIDTPELERLEGQTRRLLHASKAWIVDESDQTRNFHPHITAQKTERVYEGDNFRCDRLYIVSQHDGFKQIDSEIVL